MQRINVDPTHEYQGYQGYKITFWQALSVRPASLVPGGVNFSVFSRHAN